MKSSGGRSSRFDRAFYQRFYFRPDTAVTTASQMSARARLIAACADYLEIPVKRMLDAGCGIGLMRKPLERALPKARYTGLEVSEYLCERYGWEQGTIEDYRPRKAFDLVVCDDVLQYLDLRSAQKALLNLANLCRGLLFFGALTREDWRWNCDRTKTDPNVYLRLAAWYRARLTRRFYEIGAGFWLCRSAPTALWELEFQRHSRRS